MLDPNTTNIRFLLDLNPDPNLIHEDDGFSPELANLVPGSIIVPLLPNIKPSIWPIKQVGPFMKWGGKRMQNLYVYI